MLYFQDRIKLGSNTLFLYIGFPKERSNSDQIVKYDFDMFMTELAEHEGLSMELNTPRSLNPLQDDSAALLLFQEFVNIIPKIAEANAISEELQKVCIDASIKY